MVIHFKTLTVAFLHVKKIKLWRPEGPKIEAAYRVEARRAEKWRPQADNMAKIKQTGIVAICPLVVNMYITEKTLKFLD